MPRRRRPRRSTRRLPAARCARRHRPGWTRGQPGRRSHRHLSPSSWRRSERRRWAACRPGEARPARGPLRTLRAVSRPTAKRTFPHRPSIPCLRRGATSRRVRNRPRETLPRRAEGCRIQPRRQTLVRRDLRRRPSNRCGARNRIMRPPGFRSVTSRFRPPPIRCRASTPTPAACAKPARSLRHRRHRRRWRRLSSPRPMWTAAPLRCARERFRSGFARTTSNPTRPRATWRRLRRRGRMSSLRPTWTAAILRSAGGRFRSGSARGTSNPMRREATCRRSRRRRQRRGRIRRPERNSRHAPPTAAKASRGCATAASRPPRPRRFAWRSSITTTWATSACPAWRFQGLSWSPTSTTARSDRLPSSLTGRGVWHRIRRSNRACIRCESIWWARKGSSPSSRRRSRSPICARRMWPRGWWWCRSAATFGGSPSASTARVCAT